MTFISKILLYNSGLFPLQKGGRNLIQKLPLRETHFMRSNYPKWGILSQDNTLSTVKRFIKYKHAVRNSNSELPTSLNKINLLPIIQNADKLPIGALIATFQKLRFIYYARKGQPSFYRDLNHLTRSKVFHDFCQILEKELPKLQPSYLSPLIDLVYFKISPESVIMRKLFVLILDNIHFFPSLDLVELYCQLQEKDFRDIPECKLILEGCEKYFEKHLEDEISHYEDIKDMSYLISEKVLPVKIRKALTEKCLSLIESNQYNLTVVPKFFRVAFEEPILSLYKTELLDKFKLILESHRVPKVQEEFSKIYRNIVNKYDSLYDEEICKMFSDNTAFIFTDSSYIKTSSCLCEIGYYDQELYDKAPDLILTLDPDNFPPHLMLRLVSILVETSFHETNNPHWGNIKSKLESYNPRNKFMYPEELYLWCEFLTFMQCDTTSLFSYIFENHEKNKEISNQNSRSVLRLHHVCKKYFPDSGIELPPKLLDNCLQNSVFKKDFYVKAYVNQFFGSSDYVLENCLTPDYHFLPLVAFLGPDNKPIDLSEFKTKNFNQFHRKSFNVTVNIENIERPPGTKILAFLMYPSCQSFKFRNAPITSGFLKMFLKPYEGLNFNVILLPQKYFLLEDDEKFKYLNSEVNKIIERSDTASVRNEI